MKIAFFDAKPYDRQSFDQVNEAFRFNITYFYTHLNADTVKLTHGFNAVCVFVNDSIDKPVIDHLVDCGVRIVALRCAGYNNVDFTAAFGRLPIVRVPTYSPFAVAEHAAALMLSLNRKTHKAYYRTREGNFSINGLLGFDMYKKTAGIIGAGKIGRCLINILQGFGMKVLVYDLFPDQAYARDHGIIYTSLSELYNQSDVISLHCPLTPDTRYMINQETISNFKDGVMIINTGRGQLIDTKALIEGLKSRKIGAAGLDVYEEESEYFFEDRSVELITDDVLARLLTFPNVLVTSHQGFFTAEALNNIAYTTLKNLNDFFENGSLINEICYKCQELCPKKKVQGEPCFRVKSENSQS